MTRFRAIIDYVIVTAHAHSVAVDTWLLGMVEHRAVSGCRVTRGFICCTIVCAFLWRS